MRQILLKAKRRDNNEWIEGQLAYFFDQPGSPYIMPKCYFASREFDQDEEGNPIISDTEIAFGGFISVIPETVSQYTGQNDKNGVKIFEGDINQKDYVILWHEEKCLFAEHYFNQFEQKYVIASYPISNIDRMEITGNIYDNK